MAGAIYGGDFWLAYYDDWSGFAIFGGELVARRYAMDSGRTMQVIKGKYGQDLRQLVRDSWADDTAGGEPDA